MINFLNKYKITILFIILGAVSGYLYWHFVGCNSGTCAITSKWQNSTLYGSVFGYLIGDFVNPTKRKKKTQARLEPELNNESKNEG